MSGGVLSLLGLALRGGRLAVGEEPAALAARAGQARLLLLASDAAGNTLRRAEHLAAGGHCLWLVTPFSKAELGGALGRGSAAIAALTDTGLAAAVAERLAQMDPERYGEAAARMDLKRRRAKERQNAPRRDPPPKERRPAKPRRTPASPRDGDRRKRREEHSPARGTAPGKGRPGGKPGGQPGRNRPSAARPGGTPAGENRAPRKRGGPGPRSGGGHGGRR